MQNLCLAIVLSPLLGALISGLFGKKIGRAGAHWVTIIGVGVSFALSLVVFLKLIIWDEPVFNQNLYLWLSTGGLNFYIGFLIDELSATMMLVVTFVSWMVHIYTIGYMRDDLGYQRFFSYISLFTFSMLMLVMSNNFLPPLCDRPTTISIHNSRNVHMYLLKSSIILGGFLKNTI